MIVFACWAWRDCYFFNRFTNQSGPGIAQMNGGIAIARITHYLGTGSGSAPPSKSWRLETFPPPLFIRSGDKPKAPKEGKSSALHEPFTVKESWSHAASRETGSLRVFIPYWLILSGIAFLWLSLLLWRARRRSGLHAPG